MKKTLHERLSEWMDVFFLSLGMLFISLGVFMVYVPAGYIVLGACFIALAFFVAKNQAVREKRKGR